MRSPGRQYKRAGLNNDGWLDLAPLRKIGLWLLMNGVTERGGCPSTRSLVKLFLRIALLTSRLRPRPFKLCRYYRVVSRTNNQLTNPPVRSP